MYSSIRDSFKCIYLWQEPKSREKLKMEKKYLSKRSKHEKAKNFVEQLPMYLLSCYHSEQSYKGFGYDRYYNIFWGD